MIRFFRVVLPFASADDDPLAPGGGGTPKRVHCDFCECDLALDGNVLKMSAKAKDLAKIDTRVEKLTAELEEAKARIAELTQDLAAAKAALDARPPAPAPRINSSPFDFT